MTAHLPSATFAFLALRSAAPASVVRRAVLVIAIVCGIFFTSGWTAVRAGQLDLGPMAAALAGWRGVTVDGRHAPDPGADPARVARFFSLLSDAERTRLAEHHPLVVGNLDGAPLTLRYRANRIALADARVLERERLHDPTLSATGHEQASERLRHIDSLSEPGRQVLAFDPTAGGRVAEVLGDLRHADRVSVVVPGADTELSTFERPGNESHTAPSGMARELYAAERADAAVDDDPGSRPRRTAVVAWADYTAPMGLGMDAATGRTAEAGAERLQRMISALPGDPKTALFCHSYGSVLCGVAAPGLPATVTDIAVAGSPGMRVENTGQLHTSARVWAARGPDDWIEDVPHFEFAGLGHGADPVSEGFGARVVSAAGAAGHADYFRRGTASLANFAAIAAGHPTEVPYTRP